MPAIVLFRKIRRWKGSVMVGGKVLQKLFPDDSRESRRLAYRWEEDAREQLLKGTTDTICWTVFDWAETYLDFSESRFVTKVYREKRGVFSWFIAYLKKPEFMVSSITPRIVNAFFQYQNKEVKRSGYSINKIRKHLSAAWEWGCKYLDDFPTVINPFRRVDKYPEVRSPRYVPPESDFWRVYEAAEGQDRFMLLTFLHTAARRSEIFNLTWSDIDFVENRIRLWTRKRKGGNSEFDWLPMTGELKSTLVDWYEDRPIKDIVSVFFWTKEDGSTLPFTARAHFMKKLCARAGVIPFGFHAIRHLTATILYRKGYPVSVIQAILRHRNAGTTTQYLHSLGLEETRHALEEGISRVVPLDFKVNQA